MGKIGLHIFGSHFQHFRNPAKCPIILLPQYGNMSVTVKCTGNYLPSVNIFSTENIIIWGKVLQIQ